MRIVEVRRHAERDANEDLTAKGLEQCEAARASLDLPYDAYFRSPARRARLTMEAFGPFPATVLEELAPRPRGPFSRFEARHRELVEGGMDAVSAWFSVPEAFDKLQEVGRRCVGAVLAMAATVPEGGRALAVSHGGVIEPMAVVASGRPYGTLFGASELGNCEGVVARIREGRFLRIDVVRLPV